VSEFLGECGARDWVRQGGFAKASGAEFVSLRVDAVHVVRGSHYTIPFQAMMQAQSVTQFVDGFFLQPFQEQTPVCRQSVKFLPQAAERYKSALPSSCELHQSSPEKETRKREVASSRDLPGVEFHCGRCQFPQQSPAQMKM
jgi:hypothetical protein